MKENRNPEARRKFVMAFNSTMIRIWKERISLLGVVHTGALYRSVIELALVTNADASEVRLQQQFLTYGLWQNYGTGREVARGNTGDIGRPKVRKARRWFDVKYYASVMNLREFFCESLSLEYIALVSNALSDRTLRQAAVAN